MKSNYQDIRSKIPAEPIWYDENGTPRYAVFSPTLCPNIYARRVVLMEIACQACGQKFQVEMHWGPLDRVPENLHQLHYGDPPIHGCVGDTMNCDDLRVLEVWRRDRMEWTRAPEAEGPIDEEQTK